MLIMGFLLVGTHCIIYATSYMEVYHKNQEMLKRYIEAYEKNGNPQQSSGGRGGLAAPGFPQDNSQYRTESGTWEQQGEERVFELSTFYSVAVSDGEAVSIDDHGGQVYTKEQLTNFAFAVIDKGKKEGIYGSLVFRMVSGQEYTLVAFMDNTIVQESNTSFFKYTILFSGAAFVAVFFLSMILAKRIVKPMEDTYHAQKQFISDAGHELKTPVSAISANAEILSKEIGENPWLSNIQSENDRMAAMVRQLLELARTEQAVLPMERVELGRLVLGETLVFEAVAFEKGLRLSCDAIDENICVYGNEERLGQLVSILLDNAMEHSTPGGEVSVSLCLKHNKACLSVINTGEEIPKEQRGLIFERFYRGDFSRTGGENHYGLGLAIAKAVVMVHKGNISVECGQGLVTFTVMLPLRHT